MITQDTPKMMGPVVVFNPIRHLHPHLSAVHSWPLSTGGVWTGGASKDDGEKGIVQTIPFTALIPATGGSGYDNEQTTLMIHDSLAA
jgi:hypothetical protein